MIDLDSTNGTYVNDEPEPVTDCQLRRGDQVKIGDTIFKYLSGSDVEAQYHETIFNMTITDGLTDVSNKKRSTTCCRRRSRARSATRASSRC